MSKNLKNKFVLVMMLLIIMIIIMIGALALNVSINSTVEVFDNSIDDSTNYKYSSQGFAFQSATSQLWFSNYPYIERGIPTRLTFRILRDTDYNFIVDNLDVAKITLYGNTTFNLTYDQDFKGYTIGLNFDKLGDVPFTTQFKKLGSYVKPYTGTLKIRKFANLTVQVYSNDNGTMFNKKNTVIIAYGENNMKVTDSAYFTNIISSINSVNDYLYKTLGMPTTGNTWLQYYEIYPTPVFYGFTVKGKAVVRIPVNQSMTLRMLGTKTSDGIVVSGNSYATLYHKELTFDVPLLNAQIRKDQFVGVTVTDWDINFSATLWGWIIRIICIVATICIPLILYAYTGNSQLAWNVFGILFVSSFGISLGYSGLRLIFGF